MKAVTAAIGAPLTPSFESLLDSFKFGDLFAHAHGSVVLEEVNLRKLALNTIFERLDAEVMGLNVDGRFLKSCFSELRDLAYEVDDVLYELITFCRRRKFHVETEPSSSRVGKLLSLGLNSISRVKFSAGMVSKVKAVSQRLENIKRRIDLLKDRGGRENCVARPLCTSSLRQPKVCGREDDYKAILEMMKNEAGDGGRRIPVISVVGMGGVGKTTLAQMVYNDDSLQFNFKVWAFIGKVFDLITVTKTIVEQMALQSDGCDLSSLQLKLRDHLRGKKFLVVLDDLWSDDFVGIFQFLQFWM